MTIPKKVTIGCFDIEIIKDKDVGRNESLFGSWSYQELKIVIDSGALESIQNSTFIHECIEAMNTILRLNIEHNKIHLLEVGIYQMIQAMEETDDRK